MGGGAIAHICVLRGEALDDRALGLARAVGVAHPARIRIWAVPVIPPPEDPELRQLALEQNLIGPDTAGLTLGYGVFIVKRFSSPRLLSHEFRHVYQFEQAGSLARFLPQCLQQIAEIGYDNAPYELDARAHEHSAYPDD